MSNKYFGGVVNTPDAQTTDFDRDLISCAEETVRKVDAKMDELRVGDALEAILDLLRRCNKYIDETAPWVLAKNEDTKPRLGTVLYNLLESIRYIAVLIEPFMPDTNKAILKQINCDCADYESLKEFGAYKAGTQLDKAVPLFARIDAKQFEEELTKMQQANAAKEQSIEEVEEKLDLESIPKIGIDDFDKCDIRVGDVIACEKVKKSKKLLKFTIFDGTGERTIVSGIAMHYQPDELVGKKILFVANLKPVKLCGVESQGMILSAEKGDGLTLITLGDIDNGSKIV
jgi:methionyl-tRNA synthetase